MHRVLLLSFLYAGAGACSEQKPASCSVNSDREEAVLLQVGKGDVLGGGSASDSVPARIGTDAAPPVEPAAASPKDTSGVPAADAEVPLEAALRDAVRSKAQSRDAVASAVMDQLALGGAVPVKAMFKDAAASGGPAAPDLREGTASEETGPAKGGAAPARATRSGAIPGGGPVAEDSPADASQKGIAQGQLGSSGTPLAEPQASAEPTPASPAELAPSLPRKSSPSTASPRLGPKPPDAQSLLAELRRIWYWNPKEHVAKKAPSAASHPTLPARPKGKTKLDVPALLFARDDEALGTGIGFLGIAWYWILSPIFITIGICTCCLVSVIVGLLAYEYYKIKSILTDPSFPEKVAKAIENLFAQMGIEVKIPVPNQES